MWGTWRTQTGWVVSRNFKTPDMGRYYGSSENIFTAAFPFLSITEKGADGGCPYWDLPGGRLIIFYEPVLCWNF